ncbi:hypothetical protein [uncultured Pontibacter sp.]|uniref:hypothetical protein n=1 Tax=uncultured Pontibacter sp. TaxID=453356 RepID=UPI002609D18B|nr:hypothetical protein [uncultured Pontibacter sp.]
MDRRDNDRYDRNDYGSYEGYRNDEHYHGARNLTDKFERDFQRERGYTDYGRSGNIPRSYHEGDMGDAYERYSRQGRGSYRSSQPDYQQNDRDRNRNYSDDFSQERNRYSNYQDDYRSYQGMGNRDRDSGQDMRGNIRRGYGISSFDGTSDRYNTLGSSQNRGSSEGDQAYYAGNRDGFRSSRFGGGMGESSTHSDRGIPNYGTRNFADNYGTGMGSTYGGTNYGGGTGYESDHRGGSFGNSTYGSSSGNYGGSGAMGGGTYGGRSSSGRGDTSHNSDRGTTELGGF